MSSDIFLERPLPSNVEAEKSVLGAILLDNQIINQTIQILRVDDFYLDPHRKLYEAMLALSSSSKPIDPITLREQLQKKGEYEACGGAAYIAALADFIPRLENVEQYARIVKDKAKRRRLIAASNRVIYDCFEVEVETEDIFQSAEKEIFAIAEDKATDGFVKVGPVAQKRIEEIEQANGRLQTITGIETGFHDLDKMTAGLQKSDLIILAARPAMGKSALALNIAQYASKKGCKVGVFSLEMSTPQLVGRLICGEAHVDSNRFRNGYLSHAEWTRLYQAIENLELCDIYIDDKPGITTLEMRAKARRLQQETGLDLLIIDYLQLIGSKGKSDTRTNEVSQISRDLKILAKEMNIPVLALSQLSRAPETRPDHRPQLSDLRDSGSIEQDADIVAFIYREEVYNPIEENRGTAELIIGKQRNGPIGTIQLSYLSEFTRFENLWRDW